MYCRAKKISTRKRFVFPAVVSAFLILVYIGISVFNQPGAFFSLQFINRVYASQSLNSSLISLPKWPHEESDLQPDPQVLYGRLENGFRYVVMKNQEPKDRVSLHLNVQVGSAYEADDELGLAHFLEHMLFTGSTHFKPGELIKFFQNIGMQFGPDANASTGFFETVYDILLPFGDEKSLADGLLVLKDYSEGALLLPSEIDRERRVVLAEKRSRDSVGFRTFVSTLQFELPDTLFPKRLPIGTAEVLKSVGQEKLKRFYDTWYRPDKLVLIMVGDVDLALADSLIKKKFSDLEPRAAAHKEPKIGTVDHNGIESFYHFEKESGNTEISIELLRKIDKRTDTALERKKLITQDVADRIVQNRLNTILSQPNPPFSSAAIGSGSYLRRMKYAQIEAQSDPENWEKSLATIEQTLRQALNHGFTEEELDRVKKDFTAELENAVKKASTRNSRTIARKIISHINNARIFQSPKQVRDLYVPMIQSLSLTQVHQEFTKTWAVDHRLVLVTGNVDLNDKGYNPQRLIVDAFKKSQATPVSSPKQLSIKTFPYLKEPETEGNIKSRIELNDLGIVQVTFENGLRLNLKKTDFAANDVRANLTFGTGRFDEPENLPGLAMLTKALINGSGVGGLKRDELDQALAGKESSVSFGVEKDHFFFAGRTVTAEIRLLFQLMYAHLVHPAYREEVFTLVMERYKQRYRSLTHSIDGSLTLTGNRFLAGEDSRFGFPPYEAFQALTLKQAAAWIDPYLKKAHLELSLVGDFDIDQVISLAAGYFGSLPKRPGMEKPIRSPIITFPEKQSKTIYVPTQIPKGLVVVAYPSDDLWDIGQTRRLSILGEIFSERLRERIREKLGATYSPFAFNRPSRTYPGYGVLFTFIHVDPKMVDTVIVEVKALAATLARSGITKDELQRVLKPTLTSLKDMLRRNGYWLNTVLSRSKKYPQQLDWNRSIMEDYAAITPEEVSHLAKKYLIDEKAAVIVVIPGEKPS